MNGAEFEVSLVRNLAFAVELLYVATDECFSRNGRGYNFTLVYSIFPLLYHRTSLIAISGKNHPGILYKALADNKDIAHGFQERVIEMYDLTISTLRIGLQINAVSINEKAFIIAGTQKPPIVHDSQECRGMLIGARRIGCILSETSPETLYPLLRATI